MHESSEREFLPALFEFFHKVNTMDRGEVIAAYQAFEMAKYHVLSADERSANDRLLERVHMSMISRMCAIICDTPPGDRKNAGRLFAQVTRRDFYFRKFIYEGESSTSRY